MIIKKVQKDKSCIQCLLQSYFYYLNVTPLLPSYNQTIMLSIT